MAEAAAAGGAPKAKKKGGLMKLLMIGGGVILLLGGGVGAGVYASGAGLVGGHGGGHADEEEVETPKLVRKDGSHVDKPHGKFDPSKYKATYYKIEDSFTSNMRDTDGFVQVAVGVSTYYDETVIKNVEANEMPVRSAVLMVLADQDAFSVSSPEGKRVLQKKLTAAINAALEEKAGFGGIDDVYFTNFIVQ